MQIPHPDTPDLDKPNSPEPDTAGSAANRVSRGEDGNPRQACPLLVGQRVVEMGVTGASAEERERSARAREKEREWRYLSTARTFFAVEASGNGLKDALESP